VENRRPAAYLREGRLRPPASSDSQLTADVRRMLEAIERLPEGEREAFELVRIQGMPQAEATRMLEVSVATVTRRRSRGLQVRAAELGDLHPDNEDLPTP